MTTKVDTKLIRVTRQVFLRRVRRSTSRKTASHQGLARKKRCLFLKAKDLTSSALAPPLRGTSGTLLSVNKC